MRLFKHYKQNHYRLLAEAKDTTTLDDVIVYECLYENEVAKTWVRSKKEFFEDIEHEGRVRPRFEEVAVEFRTTTDLNEQTVQQLIPLVEAVFEPWDSEWFISNVHNHTRYFLVTAHVDGRAVAYKLGFELDNATFYSWEGAVLPEFRRLGIATELMRIQHAWCRERGYKRVQTRSQNRFRDMIRLNLKFGFDITGTQLAEKDRIKIVFEKAL